MSRQGKVWLVGAGPGDVGLFTIKGKDILEKAEVVVYDSLVGDGVLTMVPETAEKINVGKRAGHHTMKQENINKVLLEKAQEGKRVVRLKGGDPFLFGRGGEELELLCEHKIPYEVVPGVTSCIAVPAYNGIPVTHRDFCSSVHVITGHKRAGERYNIDFEALVRTKGTLVFLMGITAMEDICKGLLEAGPKRVAMRIMRRHSGHIITSMEVASYRPFYRPYYVAFYGMHPSRCLSLRRRPSQAPTRIIRTSNPAACHLGTG